MQGFEDWGIIQEEESDNGLDPESIEYYFDLAKQFIDGAYMSQFLPNFPECVKKSELTFIKSNQTITDF